MIDNTSLLLQVIGLLSKIAEASGGGGGSSSVTVLNPSTNYSLETTQQTSLTSLASILSELQGTLQVEEQSPITGFNLESTQQDVLVELGNLINNLTTSISDFVDYSSTITAPSVSQQIVPLNSSRKYLLIQNVSDTDMFINFGSVATIGSGSIKLLPNGDYELIATSGGYMNTQEINIICSIAGKEFTAKEA